MKTIKIRLWNNISRFTCLLLFHCLFLLLPASAQPGTTFRIQGLKISLFPEVNALYRNIPTRVLVTGLQGFTIDSIYFSRGKVSVKDSVVTLIAIQGTQAFFKLFIREKNGRQKLVFSKQFAIADFDEPKPNLDGVEHDSAEHRMRMAVLGYMHLPKLKDGKNKMGPGYPVVSFEAELSGGRQADTTVINGNRLTLPFRNKVDALNGGNVIKFSNIRYLYTPVDTLTIKQPFRVYIVNDSGQKIGF
jgi:hypothetical protein